MNSYRKRGWKPLSAAFMVWLGGMLLVFGWLAAQEKPVKYSQVRIHLASPQDMATLNQAGLVFDHIDFHGSYFDGVLNNNEMALLKNTSHRYEVLVDDLEAAYRSRALMSGANLQTLETQMRQLYNVPAGFNFGSMGGYYTFAEVLAELDEMRAQFPNLISARQALGKSIENRDIWMVRISDNPSTDESEQEILYTALHHAREPQSMATVIYFMWHMLENYGVDPTVTNLVDNRELYFAPVVNPDGYVYNEQTNPNGGGFWRKNRRNNGGGIFGVDLNRNYGYQWGFDNSGSSPTPSSDTYRGTAAFSEPETQVIRDFASNRQFTMAFNYHSYSNLLIFPWGYKANFFTPDHALFVAWAQDMTQFNNYVYGTANQTVGYLVNGEANDWFYGEQTLKAKVFGFTPEVGSGADGFWPSQSRIIPLADENVYPNLVLATGVGAPPPPPTFAVTLTPNNPPIIIPKTGGSFTYVLQVTNNSSATQTTGAWNALTRPNGTIRTTVGPLSMTLNAGQTKTKTFTQSISANSPAGQYAMAFNVGTYPSTILASASFNFTKSGAVLAATATTSDGAHQVSSTTAIVPEIFRLEQNYPNPFGSAAKSPLTGNPVTSMQYSLPISQLVSLKIYDVRGREVAALVNGFQKAGYQTATWNGRDQAGRTLASGVYLYKIVAGEFAQTRKLILAR